ncbi:hypothetical protein [Escherichia coli]|uniref:hypothetical protein n=1 Tax=Escherichia coli TaxID=562 RepID=UPI001FD9AB0C|nr:hypothetical protein [Escherichia coli]UHP15163.1 hypothetical protein LQQ61_04010 [Escherichia coli]
MNLDDSNSSKFVMRNAMVKRLTWPERSGASLLMYQECCTQRGKREKKRIADDMVEIIEESFGLPRGWMDGIVSSSTNTASSYETRVLTPRQRIFLDLLDELPESEADKLLKTLEEKKQYYNMIYEEIRKKKAQNAS